MLEPSHQRNTKVDACTQIMEILYMALDHIPHPTFSSPTGAVVRAPGWSHATG
jgi:hypothetical protein